MRQESAIDNDVLDSTPPGPLRFDRRQMLQDFDRRPFAIEHDLCSHPLLQLPRLIELATTLPAASVEYNAGDLLVNQDPSLTPRNGLSIDETLRQIETCRSWMVLKNVQDDPAYSALLDRCLDQVKPVIEDVAPNMCRRRAFVFVSSPGAITPYHVDFEYNFLLQIRGDKRIKVWAGDDLSVLSEPDRERMVSGGSRNLPYKEEFAEKANTFDLSPGQGVHVPLSSPHWVQVRDEVSISFSVTFLARPGDRIKSIHRVNAFLRRRGIDPTPVGQSRVIDALKFSLHRIAGRLESVGDRLRRLVSAGSTDRSESVDPYGE